jgi:hypothetical protein
VVLKRRPLSPPLLRPTFIRAPRLLIARSSRALLPSEGERIDGYAVQSLLGRGVSGDLWEEGLFDQEVIEAPDDFAARFWGGMVSRLGRSERKEVGTDNALARVKEEDRAKRSDAHEFGRGRPQGCAFDFDGPLKQGALCFL